MAKVDLQDFLKANGLSMTTQRQLILDELENYAGHLTADQIFHRIRKVMPKISFGTVYRNLAVLVDLELVLKHNFGGDISYYEKFKPVHHHILCTECSKVEDLKGVKIAELEPEIENLTSYKVSTHHLIVTGICPKCRTKEVEIRVE
ncbi:MAG: transcriptional repressor [Candidatus Gracilibacteria bacterium]|nr:transcriptional repressor [Candidatus Gracilibacteria bacterium]